MKTLQTLITALALGSLAKQWAPAHPYIAQLYDEMKNYLNENYPAVELKRLDEAPQSTGVQFLLSDDLADVSATEDSWLVQKADEMLAAVNQYNPEMFDKLKKTT